MAGPDAPPLRDLPFRALGGQPGFAADDLEPFVDARRIAVLAYVRADGRPNQTPIWYSYGEGVFHMTTTTGSPKLRALTRRPDVTLTIQDERPPYRAVIVEGRVALRPLDDDDPTEGMARRYLGRLGAEAYDDLTAEVYAASGLTLISLVPDVLKGFDNRRALGWAERAFVAARERLPIPRRWL
ncbi:MAG: TIGR03618 family F420-dependent PPOX class oxidoreductase [Actinomycetota bacterium]